MKSSQDEQVIGWRYLDKEQFPTIQLDSALGIHPFTTYFESKIDRIPMLTNRDDQFIPTLDTENLNEQTYDAGFEV